MRHTSSARRTAFYGAPSAPVLQVVPRRRGSPTMSLTRAAAVVAAGGAVVLGGLGVVTVAATQSGALPPRPPVCVSSGAVSGLSPAQAQNARTIVAAAQQRAGRVGAYIALMVALAESDLR